ncbi:deoxyribodipyrimidine photo-lyase [Flavivirga amylovorans]|uniref:Deoxyribodipyrimidine photo-lyase n=1 Tax=Flavivirga amylovorans TaxID=870486 RepID=A0ABT8X5Q7_9FLAO|nr:deoxyribodipyrimidine photo-lyase [Flavivirga amylovorans]MDO5989225.1 deoxyribodipyrimidine photo-lyase [Flavivirga amylovorans]
MKKQTVSVFWFRRDLRLHDNAGLYKALTSGTPVLPLFIFDPDILDTLDKDDARVTFIHEQLEKINDKLKTFGRCLAIYYGKPEAVYKQLMYEYHITSVFTNRDYEPYALQRDQHIETLLMSEGITFTSFKDQVIFERNEIVKQDGTPYKVYTPYSKKWLEAFKNQSVQNYPSEKHLENLVKNNDSIFPSLQDMGFKASAIKINGYTLNATFINDYESKRNFPALNGSSKLGVHLRFGTVSIRDIVLLAFKQPNITFLKELIWREFFMQILWHYPDTVTKAFKPKYDWIVWRNDEQEFQLWCQGETGYPIVDAGMRELNTTGNMHNRVRMVVASFLCKHLLIDWRWGEAYFAKKLLDYEMSSNIGNWQWVAGCGTDAAPYFRIFNPTSQVQKFDKELNYIRKWVPEFQELTYSLPLVEHKLARERCLQVYKDALE